MKLPLHEFSFDKATASFIFCHSIGIIFVIEYSYQFWDSEGEG